MSRRTATAPKTEQSGLFDQLDGEMWLNRRMVLHGVDVFTGPTTEVERMTRFREAILKHGLDQVICGRARDGKPWTYAAAFQKLYGEKL